MMHTVYNLFSTEWAYALGWTLLHSVWQSLAIFLLLRLWLHFISPMLSKLRYALSCIGLTLTLLFSVSTFVHYTNQVRPGSPSLQSVSSSVIVTLEAGQSKSTLEQFFAWGDQLIEANIPFMLIVWTMGFVIFAVRLFTGLFYTYQLRGSVIPLQNQWTLYIQQVSKRMGITKLIEFAETNLITAPMVIGYIKPIILFPAGMLTGLSADQLETIIIHELAHVKRQDFLVNIIQSVVETVFFFNPFVWSMSADIRRERELCCDDLVMQVHGGRLAYARALAQLEEARLTKNFFALSLAENKNELLNRIKRIMEKSKAKSSGKGSIILPVILIAAGLLCASWLGIDEKKNLGNKAALDQDTTIRKNDRSSTYSRKSVITIDENGQPHEEIVEKFEGDENLRPWLEMDVARDIFPSLPPIEVAPAIPPFDLEVFPDTIPVPRFGFGDADKWEEFSKAFDDEFRAQFEDFYTAHGKDLKAMMEDLQQNFNYQRLDSFHIPRQELEFLNDELERIGEFREQFLEEFEQFDHLDAFKNLEENLDKLHENLDQLPLPDPHQYSDLWNVDINEKKLKEMLVKDGYLSDDESIKTIEWNETVLKINGVKIKDSDRQKYETLLKKRKSVNKVE